MSMSLLLNDFPSETVQVSIAGVKNVTTEKIQVGSLLENHPEYTGYTYLNTTVDGTEITTIGVYEYLGQKYIYYSVADSDEAMLLEDDEEIILHYEVTVPKYNIEYVIKGNTEGGSVTGKTLVKEAENVTFRVLTNPGYRVKNVTVNGNNIRLDANGDYSITNVQTDKIVTVTFEKIEKFTINYSNNNIRQGGIYKPDNGTTFENGSSVTLTLLSKPYGSGDGAGYEPNTYGANKGEWHLTS